MARQSVSDRSTATWHEMTALPSSPPQSGATRVAVGEVRALRLALEPGLSDGVGRSWDLVAGLRPAIRHRWEATKGDAAAKATDKAAPYAPMLIASSSRLDYRARKRGKEGSEAREGDTGDGGPAWAFSRDHRRIDGRGRRRADQPHQPPE